MFSKERTPGGVVQVPLHLWVTFQSQGTVFSLQLSQEVVVS